MGLAATRKTGGLGRGLRAVGSRSVALVPIMLVLLAGCEERMVSVMGQVAVDGVPVESGVVSFESVAGEGALGASVEQGRFDMSSQGDLVVGEYVVSAQCFQGTGRTFNDPQRGPIPEKVQLRLIDNNQRIEITPDSAGDLRIDFHTKPGK